MTNFLKINSISWSILTSYAFFSLSSQLSGFLLSFIKLFRDFYSVKYSFKKQRSLCRDWQFKMLLTEITAVNDGDWKCAFSDDEHDFGPSMSFAYSLWWNFKISTCTTSICSDVFWKIPEMLFQENFPCYGNRYYEIKLRMHIVFVKLYSKSDQKDSHNFGNHFCI